MRTSSAAGEQTTVPLRSWQQYAETQAAASRAAARSAAAPPGPQRPLKRLRKVAQRSDAKHGGSGSGDAGGGAGDGDGIAAAKMGGCGGGSDICNAAPGHASVGGEQAPQPEDTAVSRHAVHVAPDAAASAAAEPVRPPAAEAQQDALVAEADRDLPPGAGPRLLSDLPMQAAVSLPLQVQYLMFSILITYIAAVAAVGPEWDAHPSTFMLCLQASGFSPPAAVCADSAVPPLSDTGPHSSLQPSASALLAVGGAASNFQLDACGAATWCASHH